MYSIHFSRYIQFITWNMCSIHFSRYIRFIMWNMYWIAKPFVLPLQIFRILKTVHVFGLWWKNPSENETATAIPGRATTRTTSRFVCVSVYSSLSHQPCQNQMTFKHALLQRRQNFPLCCNFVSISDLSAALMPSWPRNRVKVSST